MILWALLLFWVGLSCWLILTLPLRLQAVFNAGYLKACVDRSLWDREVLNTTPHHLGNEQIVKHLLDGIGKTPGEPIWYCTSRANAFRCACPTIFDEVH